MSVYKRGKVYYMDFIVQGRRVNKSTKQKNKVKALEVEKQEYKKVLAEFESPELDSMEQGQSAAQETKKKVFTLKEALDEVYEEKWKAQASGDNVYQRVTYLIKVMGNPRLDKIDRAWIWDAKKKLSKGRSGATVNRYMAYLRFILRWARDEWEMLEKVPKISMNKESTGRTRVISPEEEYGLVKVLLTETDERRWYWPTVADLIVFLCETGLRLGEALALDEENFREKGLLQLHPDETKTKSPRTVPLTDMAQEILDRRGLAPFSKVDRYQADRAFKGAKKALGIEDKEFCLHACRHTFASRILSQGAELYSIKKLLGHTVWSTTERYSHFETKALQEAVQLLGNCRESSVGTVG